MESRADDCFIIEVAKIIVELTHLKDHWDDSFGDVLWNPPQQHAEVHSPDFSRRFSLIDLVKYQPTDPIGPKFLMPESQDQTALDAAQEAELTVLKEHDSTVKSLLANVEEVYGQLTYTSCVNMTPINHEDYTRRKKILEDLLREYGSSPALPNVRKRPRPASQGSDELHAQRRKPSSAISSLYERRVPNFDGLSRKDYPKWKRQVEQIFEGCNINEEHEKARTT